MNPTTAGRTDAARRRQQKIFNAIDQAQLTGADLSVSAIARHAGVDRSYFYRHRAMLEHLHRAQAAAPTGPAAALSRASLQADLANAHARANRLHNRVQLLEKRLSELMGEHAWIESGLGAPLDIEALQQRSPSWNSAPPNSFNKSRTATAT